MHCCYVFASDGPSFAGDCSHTARDVTYGSSVSDFGGDSLRRQMAEQGAAREEAVRSVVEQAREREMSQQMRVQVGSRRNTSNAVPTSGPRPTGRNN